MARRPTPYSLTNKLDRQVECMVARAAEGRGI